MAHGELLAPAIRAAMEDAGAAMSDLTDVAVGVGPGPFTGLRVGVVTALTLGSTLGITTHGVCSLDVLAAELAHGAAPRRGVPGRHRRAAQGGLLGALPPGASRAERRDGPHVSYPTDLAELHAGMPVVGRGATLYPDALTAARRPARPVRSALARAVVAGSVERAAARAALPAPARRHAAAPAQAGMIRAATPDDAAAITAIEDASSRRRVERHPRRPRARRPGRVVLVAEHDDALVGYASAAVIADVADLTRIAVARAARREGMGTALLAALMEAAVERGAERMMLEVADTNEPAIAFYAASGFVEVARRRDYYGRGVDAVVMEVAPISPRDTLDA